MLSFVLNAHPMIVTIGERGPTPVHEQNKDYQCSCGRRIVECPFFKQIKSRMEEKGFHFELDRMALRYRYSDSRVVQKLMIGYLFSDRVTQLRDNIRGYVPGFTRCVENKEQRIKAFMRSALEITSKQWFFDASKGLGWGTLGFLRPAEDINLKVIRLIRDPRGFCNSYRNRHRTKDSIELGARVWVKANRYIDGALDNFPPERIYRQKYEAFCQSPEDSLRKITQFLGIPPMSVPKELRSVPHHIIGNRMRLPSDGRIKIELDQKWQRELTAAEEDMVKRIAGKHAARYGYLT
jgi:hypothetical protein